MKFIELPSLDGKSACLVNVAHIVCIGADAKGVTYVEYVATAISTDQPGLTYTSVPYGRLRTELLMLIASNTSFHSFAK